MSVRHMRLATALLAFLVAFTGTAVLAAGDPIKIDRVTVQVGNVESDGRAPVTALVEGSASYGCDRVLHDPVVSRQGSDVTIQIWVEQAPPPPPGTVYCAGYTFQPVIRDINLGSLEVGIYTLRVNDFTMTFTVPGKANGDVIFRRLLAAFAAFFGDQDPSTLLPGRIVVELKDGVDFHALDKDVQQIHGRDINPAMPELSVRVIEVPPGTEQEAISVLRKNPNVKDVHQDHFTTAD